MARRYLSPREVEEEYGISFKTLEKWRAEGRGPAYIKPSPRLVLYERARIETWLTSHRVLTVDDPAGLRLDDDQ